METPIRDLAKFTISKEIEDKVLGSASQQARNLRKAPDGLWNRASENRTGRDEYVKPGMPQSPASIVTHVSEDDGTTSHTPRSIQSQIVEDGDGDLKYENGVRVAYSLQHRGNGDFVQHGRIRRMGDNLVLMPTRAARPTISDEEKSEGQLLADMQKQIRQLEAAMRALDYKRKHGGK